MRKYITEFIGTFFLVTAVGMSGHAGNFAPLAIGATLMVMIFAGGHISGAHYNPAVTIAVFIRGKITVVDAIAYIITQLVAATLASLLVIWLLYLDTNAVPEGIVFAPRGLVAEFFGTFALAYVVLNVATAKGTSGNSFYGLAIGFTVTAMAYLFGLISKGAFNPAVALGLSVMKIAPWTDQWIYVVGCFGGGIVAGVIFRILNPGDK